VFRPQAQYDADQLLTQREKVSKQIREALEERAAEFKLKLDGNDCLPN
jgi:regulator of protease activity HflC (stomatin/prohibitin superfamily)